MGLLNRKRRYEIKATEESVNSVLGKKAVRGETGTYVIESRYLSNFNKLIVLGQ